MEEELATFEHRVGKGEFNPATTKILHFALNPEVRLRAEKNSNDIVSKRSLKLERKKNQRRK